MCMIDSSLIQLKRASETQNYLLMDTQAPRPGKGQTCACVIHTNLHTLSATLMFVWVHVLREAL